MATRGKAAIPESVRETFRAWGREGGKKGGKVAAAKLTSEERRVKAKKAALARWGKRAR